MPRSEFSPAQLTAFTASCSTLGTLQLITHDAPHPQNDTDVRWLRLQRGSEAWILQSHLPAEPETPFQLREATTVGEPYDSLYVCYSGLVTMVDSLRPNRHNKWKFFASHEPPGALIVAQELDEVVDPVAVDPTVLPLLRSAVDNKPDTSDVAKDALRAEIDAIWVVNLHRQAATQPPRILQAGEAAALQQTLLQVEHDGIPT